VIRRLVLLVVAALLLNAMAIGQASARERPALESKSVLVAQAEFVTTISLAQRTYRESLRVAEATYKEALRLAGTTEAVKRAQAQAFAWQARELAKAKSLPELLQIELEMQERLRVAALHLNAKKSREISRQERDRAVAQAEARFAEAKRVATVRLNEALARNGVRNVTG
jgi:hypothetical protein